MIWKSTLLMTLIDLAIVSVTGASLWILCRRRRKLIRSDLILGSSVVVVGLLAIGLFYLVDLIIMFVLPSFMTRAAAMTLMEDLHLNYSWIVMLVGTVSIFTGFSVMNRRLFSLIDSLERSEARLTGELSVREDTERALRESEQRFQRIAKATNDAIWDWDLSTNAVWWNEGVQTLFGYSADDVGYDFAWWHDHVHPVDRERIISEVHALIDNGGQFWSDEYRYCRADGSYAYVSDRGFVLRNDSGKPARMLGGMMDITERKRAEEQLKARARQQAALAELSQRALAGADLSTIMDEAVDLLARTLEVEYCKVLQLLPDGNHLLLRAGVGWREGYVRHTTVGAGTDSQAGYTLLSSEPVIVEDLGMETRFSGPLLLHDHGVVSGLSIIIHGPDRPFGVLGAHTTRQRTFTGDDVHFLQAAANVLAIAVERKRVDETLRVTNQELRGTRHYLTLLIESSTDAIISTNKEGNVALFNKGAEALLGYQRQEIIGRRVTAVYESEERAKEVMAQMRQHGGIVTGFETTLRAKDGNLIPVLISASILADAEGEETGTVGFNKDLRERKGAEEALQRAYDDLERRVEERTAVLSKTVGILEQQVIERKRAQEALHESREHFRRLVETVNVVPWEADGATWRFTYVGPQAVRMLGYPLEAWFEDDFWVNHIHPEDREYATNFCLDNSLRQPDFEFEYRMLAVDGRVIWVRDIVTVVPGNGGIRKLRGFMLDITERRRVEEQLRNSEDRLRALSNRLLSVQEEERTRIAREVHDELGAALTALKIDLAWVAQRLGDRQGLVQKKIQAMTHLTDGTIRAVRRIATELRPGVLDHLGLLAALEWQVREFQDRTGISCVFTRNPENIAVDPARATTVFRICQEALTNIARHAHATRVDLNLRKEGADLFLEVQDDGRGIQEEAVADPKSLGLIGIRERIGSWGGDVRIGGLRGKGTVVTVCIPLGEREADPCGGIP